MHKYVKRVVNFGLSILALGFLTFAGIVAYMPVARMITSMNTVRYSCEAWPSDKLSGLKVVYVDIVYNPYASCVPNAGCLAPDAVKEDITTIDRLSRQLPLPSALTDEGVATALKEFFRLRKEAYEQKARREFKGCQLPEIKVIKKPREFNAFSTNIKQGNHDAFALRIEIHRNIILGRPFYLVTMKITQSEPESGGHWGGPWIMPETVTTQDWAQAMYRANFIPWK